MPSDVLLRIAWSRLDISCELSIFIRPSSQGSPCLADSTGMCSSQLTESGCSINCAMDGLTEAIPKHYNADIASGQPGRGRKEGQLPGERGTLGGMGHTGRSRGL